MINLEVLTDNEVIPFFNQLWIDYKAELIAAGFSEGYANENIEQNMKSIFSNGTLAPGNFLFYAISNGNRVGKLWLTTSKRDGEIEWSIYDVETFVDFRGRGIGREIMLAAERYVLAAGGDAIYLSVFGNNSPARKLYESLDYQTIRLAMKKNLNA